MLRDITITAAVILVAVVATFLTITWIAKARKRLKSKFEDESDLNSGSPIKPQGLNEQPRDIIIGSNSDPLVRISFATDALTMREPIEIAGSTRRQLEMLLDGAKLAKQFVNVQSTKVVLEFSPSVSEQLVTGSAHLVPSAEGGFRAIARSTETGRYIGHASIRTVTRVDPAILAGAVWQLAAVATSQKFLADIDRRLGQIQESVQCLRSALEGSRRSRLDAGLRYLHQISATLRAGSFTEMEAITFCNQIEEIERSCLEVTSSISDEMRKPVANLQTIKMRSMRPNAVTESIEREIQHFGQLMEGLHAATVVRAAGVQLRNALPVEGQLTRSRLDEIRRDHQELLSTQRRVLVQLKDRVGELKTYLPLNLFESRQQERLFQSVTTIETHLNACTGQSSHALDAVAAQVLHIGAVEPLRLAVDLDERGQIVGTYRMALSQARLDRGLRSSSARP
jgi:hypothetical protein